MLGDLIATGDNPYDYSYVHGLYTAHFGEANVIALPYELLQEDLPAFIADLDQRLALPAFPPSAEAVNPALSATQLAWYPQLSRLAAGISRIPVVGPHGHRRYLAAALHNRLARPIALLDRLSPRLPVTLDHVPDELVEAFGGSAERLRPLPHYSRYAGAYLIRS
jgi:hypothetical protein